MWGYLFGIGIGYWIIGALALIFIYYIMKGQKKGGGVGDFGMDLGLGGAY